MEYHCGRRREKSKKCGSARESTTRCSVCSFTRCSGSDRLRPSGVDHQQVTAWPSRGSLDLRDCPEKHSSQRWHIARPAARRCAPKRPDCLHSHRKFERRSSGVLFLQLYRSDCLGFVLLVMPWTYLEQTIQRDPLLQELDLITFDRHECHPHRRPSTAGFP